MSMLRSLWAYKSFILGSLVREFRLKFTGSILGAWWVVLAPLTQVLMYAIVLSNLMQARLPGQQNKYAYAIYLLAGMAGWSYVLEMITRSTTVFLEHANLLKKLSFPHISLPVIVTMSASINHVVFLVVTIMLTIVLGGGVNLTIFSLVPLVLVAVSFSLSLGILLGVLNVFYRDIGHFVSIVMQFWFWATPIVYTIDILPTKIQPYMKLNPMAPIIEGYQRIIYLNQFPDWKSLLSLMVLTCLLSAISYSVFRKAKAELVDAL